MRWLMFLFGMMVGGSLGVVLAGLLAAASRYDDELDGPG